MSRQGAFRTFLILGVAVALGAVLPALADWDVGDPHKMHFPQLPDPVGWDVEIVTFTHEIADDWQCSETGAVEDVHFWVSCPPEEPSPPHPPGPSFCDVLLLDVMNVTLTIWDNEPVEPGVPYSRPLSPIWGPRVFGPGEFTWRLVDSPPLEGFATPLFDAWNPAEHFNYFQINVENIQEPFTQQAGEIYWLSIYVDWPGGPFNPVGWKTSTDHFEDVAVWLDPDEPEPWQMLVDPTGQELDLAFVITGAPAIPAQSRRTLAVLGVALVAGLGWLVLRRRRFRSA